MFAGIIPFLLVLFEMGQGASPLRPFPTDMSCILEDQPNAALKKFNESCNSTNDCLNGGGPVICNADKVCGCAPGFIAVRFTPQPFAPFLGFVDTVDTYVCRPLPTLHQPCTTQCAAPLQCVSMEDESESSETSSHINGLSPLNVPVHSPPFNDSSTPGSPTPGSTSASKIASKGSTATSSPVNITLNTTDSLVNSSTTAHPRNSSSLRSFEKKPVDNSFIASKANKKGNVRDDDGGFSREEFSKDDPFDNFWSRHLQFSSRQTPKTCRCMPPYKMINYQCQLECRDGEFYTDGKCRRRAALGESCETDEQCSAAFSGCTNGTCECRGGFLNMGNGCIAKVANCEFGEPLRSSGINGSGIVQCIYNNPIAVPFTGGEYGPEAFSFTRVISVCSSCMQDSASQNEDDSSACPSDYFCQPFDNPVNTPRVAGFCCPKQKKLCPMGDPHPTANCSMHFGIQILGVQDGDGKSNGCPSKTHYCYQRLGSSPVCCPRACPQGLVLAAGGHCLPMLEIGAKCQASEQCGGNSACIDAICACPNKTALMESRRGHKFCSPQCDYRAEVNFNNRCYSRLKLGDQCRGKEYRCPVTAYCGRRGVCQCPCGTVQINETVCAPPPSCPQQGPNGDIGTSGPGGNDFGSLFSEIFSGSVDGDWGPVQSRRRGGRRRPSWGQRDQGPSPKEIYGNATLCQISGRKAANDRALAQCPHDQVCLGYLEDMGVCCPKPEPFCPSGAIPEGPCNGGASNDCGGDSICFRYIQNANLNSTDGFVCCPRNRFQHQRFFGPQHPFDAVLDHDADSQE